MNTYIYGRFNSDQMHAPDGSCDIFVITLLEFLIFLSENTGIKSLPIKVVLGARAHPCMAYYNNEISMYFKILL
jgi:hypothetical protein